MSYSIELTETAISDIQKHKRAGDKKSLRKIGQLLDELRVHPASGSGKPERLKYFKEAIWSRRINGKHRLIHKIQDRKVLVLVLSCWGPYEDK